MRSRLSKRICKKLVCAKTDGTVDLQTLWPASSDMSRLTYCCCIAVIACVIGLFHMARASSRLTSVHANTSQNNSGCEVLQRVYRPASRSHMLEMRICVHKLFTPIRNHCVNTELMCRMNSSDQEFCVRRISSEVRRFITLRPI